MVGVARIPQWLEALLSEKFFKPCLFHEFEKKSEKNTFCLDCSISLCPHCLPPHRNHYLLQIRRYVYQNVIRLRDAQKVTDCSSVQPYTTNRAKVVFINHKPMVRPFRGLGNTCVVCGRSLQDSYLFCSLSCKVNHTRDVAGAGIRKLHLTRHSIFELPVLPRSNSSGSSSSNEGAFNFTKSTLACTATNDFSKKKRSRVTISRTKCRPKCAFEPVFSEAFNRRKGIPHRSPLY